MTRKQSFQQGAWAPDKHNAWIKVRNRINKLLKARVWEVPND